MALRDALSATGIGTAFALLADVLVTGGDFLLFISGYLVDVSPTLFLVLSRLAVAAPEIEWLPTQRIQQLLAVVAILAAVVVALNLGRNLIENWRSQ